MKNRIVLMCALLLSPVMAFATVTGTATSASFTCTGSTGPYSFTFPIDTAAAMTVVQNGVVLSSSAYAISPVNNSYDNGGSVTLNTACPNGQTLVLQRVTPITQLTQFTPYMPALYENIENGLDKVTEIEQELNAVKLPCGTVPAGIPCGGTGSSTAAGALANLGGEPALGNPSTTGYVLSSTNAGIRSWVANSGGGCPLTGCTFTGPVSFTPSTGQYGVNATGIDYAAAVFTNNHSSNTMGTPAENALEDTLYLSGAAYRGYAAQSSIFGNPLVTNNHLIGSVSTVYAPSIAKTTSGGWGYVAQLVDQTTETGYIGGSGFRVEAGGTGQPQWVAGFEGSNGCCNFFMLVDATSTTAPVGGGGSMPIGFGWWDSAGNYHYGAQVQADSSGDLIVIPGTGAGTASMLLFGNLTTNSVILSPNGTGTGLSSYPLFFQYGSSSAPSTTSIVADLNGTLHMPSSLFYAGANFAGATYLSPNGTGTGLNSYPLAFQYGSSSSPSAVSIYAGYDGALRIPASIISGLTVNGTEYISALAGANANSNYLTFQSTLASATQVFQIYTDYANNYLHMGGSVSAVSYLAGTNLILPSTLTGFHGTGAGDVMVQFSDGSGSSGYAAVYDAYGGLTNGGGAPALLSGATFTGPVGIYGIFSNALFSTYGTSTLSGTSITGYAAVYTANSYQASSVYGFLSFPTTAAGISVANVNGYSSRFSIGAGGSVGSYSGFHDAEAYLHLATNNAAFSDNTSYTGNYFIHQLYSDPSVFGGQVTVTGPIQINPIGTATSVSGNYSSYNFQELGSYWNGTAAAGDTWFINNVLGTGTAPTSTLTIQHTGSSGLATVSVPSLTAGAGFAVAASGATSVAASGVSVVPLTLYGHNVSQTADLLDVYNYSGGSIVAAISPTGGLAGSSLVITGCGAGYYAKADGAGCGIPAGTYSLPTATSSTLGGVKPDGSTITNTSGAISVNYGTTSGTAAQGNDSRITGAAQCTAGTASGNCITNSMTGLGDLLYGGASGASTKLTGFTGGDGQLVVLTETTSGGGAAQAPAWVLPSTMTVGYAGTSTNVDGATNCILYNSSTNITGCISGVNNAVVVTNSSGTPSEVTTLPAANLPAATPTVAGVVVKVANTTFTTSTSSVAANTCNSTVQVAMTGVTTSMTFGITPSADTSAAAGWGSTGGLVLDTWPTAGYLNYKICNQTTAAISTPGAVTFNVSAQ